MLSPLVATLSAGHFAVFLEWSFSLTAKQNIQLLLSKGNTKVAVQFLTFSTTASALANVFSTPKIGQLLDTYGRKPIILAGFLVNFISKMLFALNPSFITLALKNVFFGIGVQMIRLGAQASFSDSMKGEELSHALNVFNASMGFAMLCGSSFGAWSASSLGNKTSLLMASCVGMVGYTITSVHLQDTNKDTKNKQTHANTSSSSSSNPLLFLKIFRDARLAKLCLVNCLHYMADSTFELDQIFLRTHVHLNNDTMGYYGQIRGVSYGIGMAVSRILMTQCKIGSRSYTQFANAVVICYLVAKARTKSTRGMYVFSLFYMLAPLYVRSSGVVSEYYSRGVELGLARGELSAMSSSLINWVQIIQPTIFSAIYNGSSVRFKGTIYYIQALLVAVSSLLIGST